MDSGKWKRRERGAIEAVSIGTQETVGHNRYTTQKKDTVPWPLSHTPFVCDGDYTF